MRRQNGRGKVTAIETDRKTESMCVREYEYEGEIDRERERERERQKERERERQKGG